MEKGFYIQAALVLVSDNLKKTAAQAATASTKANLTAAHTAMTATTILLRV